MKSKMIMLCLALASWCAIAQRDQAKGSTVTRDQNIAEFKDVKLGSAYERYINLKNVLIASKSYEAKEAAIRLQLSLSPVKNGMKAFDEAAKVATASTLDDQRKAFEGLSNEMAALVKAGRLLMGRIYVAYCPMANAYWLSNEKHIKNPYYGDKMLYCGSVKETIQ